MRQIPVRPAADAAEPRSSTRPGVLGEQTLLPVLIVDGDVAARQVLRRTLWDLGYAVLEAGHGGQALELLARLNGQVRFVITAFAMPVLGGVDLIREIRRRWPGLPHLCATAYTLELAQLNLYLDPPCRTVNKPFDPEQLAEAVREVAGPE